MNQRTPNRIVWYSLVLILVLCIGFGAISAGTAFARYRTELEKSVTFEVQEPEQISLGTLEDKTFTTKEPVWEKVEIETEPGKTKTILQMELAMANGTSDTVFSQQDQRVSLRLLGSVGLWDGEAPVVISLLQGKEPSIQATATPIAEGTALYHSFGAGWIFTFQDTEGEELSWNLPGGQFNYVRMTVTIENAVTTADSLIQTLVVGKVIGE